jgi:hypothetical protein
MPADQAFDEYNKNKNHEKTIDYYDRLKKAVSIAKKEYDALAERDQRMRQSGWTEKAPLYQKTKAEFDEKKKLFDEALAAFNDAMSVRDQMLAKEKQWGDVREQQRSIQGLGVNQSFKGRQIYGNFHSTPSQMSVTGENGQKYNSIGYGGLDGGYKSPAMPAPYPAPPQRPVDLAPTLKNIESIFSGGKIEATVKPDQVKAQLEGKADVNITSIFKVEASSELLRVVEQAKNTTSRAEGAIRANTGNGAGSTGVTMPEVAR